MSWVWTPRSEPLEPVGMTAQGEVARRLARRLRGRAQELAGVRAGDRLVILGPDLPWVDGVVYLGRQQPFHPVLTPTNLQPDWPLDWIAEVLKRKSAPPWAVLPELVIGLSRASRIEDDML